MKYLDIFEAKTKDGQEIIFELWPDVEGDLNRGWIVDQIVALVDDNPIGYIKISYIPKERFEKWYPNIFAWLENFKGHHFYNFTDHMKENPIEKWDEDETKEFLKKLTDYWGGNRYFITKFDYEKGNIIKQLLKAIKNDKRFKQYMKNFIDFKNYHVDKPLVDYISVENEWKRKGIGTELYKEAAKYLASKELKLHASNIQSDEAVHVWKKFQDQGLVDLVPDVSYGKKVLRKVFKTN